MRLHAGGGDSAASQECPALRLGFRMLSGFSDEYAEKIVKQRGVRSYVSLDEFAERTDLSNSVLTRLSRADAFASLRLGRRSALWQALPDHKPTPLLATEPASTEPTVALPTVQFSNGSGMFLNHGSKLPAHVAETRADSCGTKTSSTAARSQLAGPQRRCPCLSKREP